MALGPAPAAEPRHHQPGRCLCQMDGRRALLGTTPRGAGSRGAGEIRPVQHCLLCEAGE